MSVLRLIAWFLLFLLRLCVQTVFLAIGQIVTRFVRSGLTMLGIIIGVFVVVASVGFLTGMKGYVLKEFETFGARKMWCWGYVPEDKRTTMSWTDAKVTLYEAEMILDRAPSIDSLTPTCDRNWDVTCNGKVTRGVEVTGIWPEWHDIEDRQVVYGRPFSRIDIDERRQVCLVNETAVEEFKLDTDPTGSYILIQGRRFLIVGLVETKQMGPMFGGGQSRAEVYIPYDTHKMMDPYSWTWFTMQMTDPKMAKEAEAEVRLILRKHRQLKPEDEDTFRLEVLQNAIQQFNGLASAITMGAGAVVGFSLFVGGIGIMNIMLASVSERTREIGLRKAVGAQPIVVLLQFLIEAVVLCVVGGGVGVLLGQGVVLAMRSSVSWMSEVSVPTLWIIVAFGSCGIVGVVSGMFPALKAAALNPINALRHE
ncbi:MAG: ABC transporter permease [Phycisphaerales bacterium]